MIALICFSSIVTVFTWISIIDGRKCSNLFFFGQKGYFLKVKIKEISLRYKRVCTHQQQLFFLNRVSMLNLEIIEQSRLTNKTK